MAGIIFYYEGRSVWSTKRDLDAWNYACKIGGIDKAIIINETDEDIQTFDADMDIQIVKELPEIEGTVAQLVCPWENTTKEMVSLWEFDHKVDWYAFGKDNPGWHGNHYADIMLTIPVINNAVTHSIFIAPVVMYHRVHTLKLT